MLRPLKQDQILNHAARFHGHLGPWLALGLRAGRRATKLLKATPFQLKAVVHCPRRTPHSCFIDGIQVGSGCTLGKGNIRHVRSSRIWVEFLRLPGRSREKMIESDAPPKARLRLEVRPEVSTELTIIPPRTESYVTNLARRVYRRPLSRLFIETLVD